MTTDGEYGLRVFDMNLLIIVGQIIQETDTTAGGSLSTSFRSHCGCAYPYLVLVPTPLDGTQRLHNSTTLKQQHIKTRKIGQ